MKHPPVSRMVLFVGLALVVAALDLGSKEWADLRLAADDHPLPALVPPEWDGKPLGEFARVAFPFASTAELDAALARGQLTVAPPRPADLAADLKPYGADDGAPRWAGLYVFHRRDFTRAPRVIPLNDRPHLLRWLGPWYAGLDREALVSKARAALGELPLARLLALRDPNLADREELLPELVRDYTVPFVGGPRPTSASVVHTGELVLMNERVVDLVPGLFRFLYRENPNGAWGFLHWLPEGVRGTLLTVFHLLAMGVIGVLFWRMEYRRRLEAVVLACIFGGAIGNLVDRFRYTFVIDFMDMYVKGNHWPTYNVADIAITLGVVVLFLLALVQGKGKKA
jgi:signal peptidase II